MTLLSRYTTSNIASLLDEIYNFNKYSTPYFSNNFRFTPINDVKGKLDVELAGYSREEIEVYVEKNVLNIKAKTGKDGSTRSFTRCWELHKDEMIENVRYKNGLLSIEITRVIPEEEKRKYYKIE
jgi:HSP20 family molecular chaperone IbpA